jgi:hypothetical protein
MDIGILLPLLDDGFCFLLQAIASIEEFDVERFPVVPVIIVVS